VWKISSGVSDEFATPRGLFKPEWTAKMWYSKKYDDAPMPHAVFFKGGAAIHATQAVGRLGTPASHGCVRLAPGNAATFYGLVQRHGMAHTQIHVFGTPNYPQYVASRSSATPRPYAASSLNTWGPPARSVQYAYASPFTGPFYYARLPIGAARVR
jgi:L,D-transpeptidase catalytic domain